MVRSDSKNWEKLVSSLKKRLSKENKGSKKESLNAVEVVCSHEDIEKTRQGWAKTKRK